MKFRLKMTQIAFMLGCSYTLQCYGAERLLLDIIAQPVENEISARQSLKDGALLDLFNTPNDKKPALLNDLIDIAVTYDEVQSKNVRQFLKNAITNGFFDSELLQSAKKGTITAKKQSLFNKKNSLLDDLLKFERNVSIGSKHTLQLPEVRAFSQPEILSVEPAELPGNLRISQTACDLPDETQFNLINVLATLNTEKLEDSLQKLYKGSVLSAQNNALENRTTENYAQAINALELFSKVRGVATLIDGYLKSVNSQLASIVPSEKKVSVGYIYNSSELVDSPEQKLVRTALEERKKLAFSVFFAFFGKIDIAKITAKQAIINADKILGASVSEVDNDGSIVGEDKQEATASIRTETKTFLESIWGVAKRTGATNIVEFKL